MIVNWKRLSAPEYTSQWQGMHLRVYWVDNAWRAEVSALGDGVLACNGLPAVRVQGAWASHHAAIDAVDVAMNKVIRRAVPPPVARQKMDMGGVSVYVDVGHVGSTKPNLVVHHIGGDGRRAHQVAAHGC